MAQSQRKKSGSNRPNGGIIVAGLILVVGLAAIVAIAGNGGSDTTTTTTLPAQYQDVKVTGSTLAPLGDTGTDASAGKVAPALSGKTFAGGEISVTPGSETQPTLLVYLAHWCPHCNREVPRLVEMHDKGLMPKDLRIVGVLTASREDQANWPPSRWIVDMKWPWEVMVDDQVSTAATAYGVDGFPFLVVVGKDGKVLARHSGEMEIAEVQSWLDTALAGS